MTYIALLRGINVGGNNIIKMADLRACFEKAGFGNVSTYIQSGNVLFDTKRTKTNTLETKIQGMLVKEFGYDGVVVVLSASELAKVVAEKPRLFGDNPKKYRYDVVFIKSPMTAKKLFSKVPARDGVDEKWEGSKVIYFARPIAEAGKSQLSKLVSQPEYRYLTIRNWNTTTTLFTLVTG